jgi:polyhydroxybutyrate depolymerase
MRRARVLASVLACIGVPPVLAVAGAAARYASAPPTYTLTTSAHQTREYILHVPSSRDASKPAPLVISMHGAMNWPEFQMDVTQWNRLADDQGFIVVYPAGEGGGPKIWELRGGSNPSRMPDVVFISELIDTLAARYTIDRARVYANGLSNGGGMSFALSCTLADRIAAFGPVSSAVTLPINWCPGARPAPVVAFHGTADNFVPYDGAKVWIAPEPFPSIPEWIAAWARRNRCATAPIDSAFNADVTRRAYGGCADDADVVLYTVKGGGHQWYGGMPISAWMAGPYSRSIDATRVMWDFFQRHPLRDKPRQILNP